MTVWPCHWDIHALLTGWGGGLTVGVFLFFLGMWVGRHTLTTHRYEHSQVVPLDGPPEKG